MDAHILWMALIIYADNENFLSLMRAPSLRAIESIFSFEMTDVKEVALEVDFGVIICSWNLFVST